MSESEIYKHTNGNTAAIKKKLFFGKNKIWIREMPIYQIFYELSHEIGHSIKPDLEGKSLHAEETKAVLFQYIFSKKLKENSFEWIDEFIAFEKFRIEHIKRKQPNTYGKYHEIAKQIVEQTSYDLEKGIRKIIEIVDLGYR